MPFWRKAANPGWLVAGLLSWAGTEPGTRSGRSGIRTRRAGSMTTPDEGRKATTNEPEPGAVRPACRSRAAIPGGLGHAAPVVLVARHHEQGIGQAVEVAQGEGA